MLADAIEAENLPVVSADQSRMHVTNTARGGSETNNQHEILVDILRNQLHAAMCLMEHREGWWTAWATQSLLLDWRWNASAIEKRSPPRR